MEGGVEGLEIGVEAGGAEAGEEGEGLGVVTEAEGEGDEGGKEGKVGDDAVGVHEGEEGEGGIEAVGAGECGDKGGVCDGVRGGAAEAAHLVEEANGKGKLGGAEGVAEDDVESKGRWLVAGSVDHPVEEGEGATVVGLAGEERDHEARGEAVLAGGAAQIRGHDGVELLRRGGLAQLVQQRGHVDAAVDVVVALGGAAAGGMQVVVVVEVVTPPYVSAGSR